MTSQVQGSDHDWSPKKFGSDAERQEDQPLEKSKRKMHLCKSKNRFRIGFLTIMGYSKLYGDTIGALPITDASQKQRLDQLFRSP